MLKKSGLDKYKDEQLQIAVFMNFFSMCCEYPLSESVNRNKNLVETAGVLDGQQYIQNQILLSNSTLYKYLTITL